MGWSTLYGQGDKPRFAQIQEYLDPTVRPLFLEFNLQVGKRFGLGYVAPIYTKEQGWKYQYGRSGYLLFRDVRFHDRIFSVEGIPVRDERSLSQAMEKVRALHEDGFLERFEAFSAERTRRRKEKAASKPPPQKEEGANDCKWPPKVSARQLLRLYDSDQRGLPDEELLDEIGMTLYARCKTAQEIYALMDRGAMRCTHCGKTLGPAARAVCSCGRVYTYREYRRSFRANNMPRGEASETFDKFVADWECAKGYAAKMRLVDNLIHEFHISSTDGTPNRPVGVNLIEGTKAQVGALLNRLAYGGTNGR